MILRAIYVEPVPDYLEWELIARFLMTLGCRLLDGSGTRVRFMQRGVVGTFQRNGPLIRRHQILDVREYLAAAGYRP